ncbi:SixA phosphatase family protein [Gaetbulibacter saemankumensis]|uniref:SixA phosphatase family protein n=1 Tax=Gaetbulibacter saemankumensis TaxID=311208 RepID=UPI000403A214|nr:histidine phosphatase family protein [Gaetbulibacter saemankumensis]
MKKLILVRHAKSSWEYDVIDHERPLNNRGENDAKLVSEYLGANNLIPGPDLILCSDSNRTKLTADIFTKGLDIYHHKIHYSYSLYDFDGRDLVKVISDIEDAVNTLLVFGHNHAITYFVNAFGDKLIENVPTSGVVVIDFDVDSWRYLDQGKTVLSLFPRDLKK